MGFADKLKGHWMMALGILLILISAFVIAEANARHAECESVPGKIIQFIDSGSRENCSAVPIIQTAGYVGFALGIAFFIINFIRRK